MICKTPLILLMCAALCSCSTPQDTVVFVTKSSLGIDFDNTPPSAAFAYERREGFFGPRFADGTLPPVAGSFFTNGGIFNRNIKQIYATGTAATTVAAQARAVASSPRLATSATKPMFFGTSTIFGLRVGFDTTGIEALTFGFKRKEASLIPITVGPSSDQNGTGTVYTFPSVIASLDTDYSVKTATGTTVGVQQYFATGAAADSVAQYPEVLAQFKQTAEDSLSRYRRDERLQAAAVMDTLSCLAELKDDKLGAVWANARSLELFPNTALYTALQTGPTERARMLYTRQLTVLNADSSMYTGLLVGHRAAVCNLRG